MLFIWIQKSPANLKEINGNCLRKSMREQCNFILDNTYLLKRLCGSLIGSITLKLISFHLQGNMLFLQIKYGFIAEHLNFLMAQKRSAFLSYRLVVKNCEALKMTRSETYRLHGLSQFKSHV